MGLGCTCGWLSLANEFSDLQKILEEALNEYNETNATMNLVLFEDAMKAGVLVYIYNSPDFTLPPLYLYKSPSRFPAAEGL